MKRTLAVLTLLICIGSYLSIAQTPGHYPFGIRGPVSEKEQIQAERRESIWRGSTTGRARSTQSFTDNGQRLIGITDYDYTATPSSQFLDSIVFKYSGPRGSFFGHFGLGYDTYNFSDLPLGGYNFFDSRINYDTMWSYDPPGSSNAVVTGIRTYNVKNDIVQSELVGNYTRTFTYNSRGQMTESKVRLYDPMIGWFDRRHYFMAYDRGGNLIWDSLARFNGTVWVSLGSDSLFYDGNDRIIHLDGWDVVNGVRTVTEQLVFTYASASGQFSTVVQKVLNTTSNSLENNYRDTIGYTNGVETIYKQYWWNDLSSTWRISNEEHRRLNADNKPDSVWYLNWSSSGVDTARTLITYNTQHNPVRLKYSTISNATPSLAFEERCYYENVPPGQRPGNNSKVAGAATNQHLELYPNPVRDVLYLKNLPAGSYLIYNSFAQVVQAGRYENGIALPMQALSPGQYVLEVQTDSGDQYNGKLTKE